MPHQWTCSSSSDGPRARSNGSEDTYPVAVITEAASMVVIDEHTADAEKMPQTTVATYHARKWPA